MSVTPNAGCVDVVIVGAGISGLGAAYRIIERNPQLTYTILERRARIAAGVVMEFANEFGLNMPIAREVDAVINHGSTVEQAYRGLIAEVPGHEVHGSGF